MQCLKCGKDTVEKHVFCQDCLSVMEKYPVKPGAAIQIPKRDTANADKKAAARHREPTPSEMIQRLSRMIRWLTAIIAVLSILLLLTAGMVLHLTKETTPTGTIGKNYTTSTSATKP